MTLATTPKQSLLYLQNPAKQDKTKQKTFKVLVVSHGSPEIVLETEIHLETNILAPASMTSIDDALKALHIKRGSSRIYWQMGDQNLMPVFNHITLAAAMHTMAHTNNIFYIIKKDRKYPVFDKNELYTVDPDDKALILELSSKHMRPGFIGYTRWEETNHLALTNLIRGEHVPKVVENDKPTQTDKETKKGNAKNEKKAKTK